MSAAVKLSIPTNDQSIEREREKERKKKGSNAKSSWQGSSDWSNSVKIMGTQEQFLLLK